MSDALGHGHEGLRDAVPELAARAKACECRAYPLMMQARDEAERQPRWQPVAGLRGSSDDVVDALEEAAFLISLIADHQQKVWNGEVRKVLARLAQTVLQATQDPVKTLAIHGRSAAAFSDSDDSDACLAALWAVLHAERQCDKLLRQARRVILSTLVDPPSLMLANDLAVASERASDHLLAASYGLRKLVFSKTGSVA